MQTKFKLIILFSWLALLWGSLAHGEIIIQIGDSVANNDTNRAKANLWLADKGIFPTWVGDHGAPRLTFARGGMTYGSLLSGRTGEPGLKDIVEDYAAPDALYILAGYNNAIFEADDSDMSGSIAALRELLDLAHLKWPSTDVFVSNVTRFSVAGNWGHKQSNVLTLNQLISTEVGVREKVHLVDNYSVISDAELAVDGLHLNFDGQTKIGREFARTYYLVSIPEPSSLILGVAGMMLVAFPRSRSR